MEFVDADPTFWPLAGTVTDGMDADDDLPATFHRRGPNRHHRVVDPTSSISDYLRGDLSLGVLDDMLQHLWFAGATHPPKQLHLQVAMGRDIVVVDRMDLHLFWDGSGRIFLKPLPRFLLDRGFCEDYLYCPDGCGCRQLPPGRGTAECMESARTVALGFLYTYACLISTESDFFLAQEKHLLPAMRWSRWKTLAREIIKSHDSGRVHPRFLRSELRLNRVNIIHRFTRLPPFTSYLRSRHNYSSLFRDNFAWMAAVTVFAALVLTAMQVGLATKRLQDNVAFQRASYGFSIFAILGPIIAFCLVALAAALKLIVDLPFLLLEQKNGSKSVSSA